ncbi:MAG: hypothetical protein AUJ75_03695 [Candidatus Omnitrophica bacterium CG1_02_49_10]|nr:MAG: hypothetical protein AUJ75_03695 [Candidatus Omnitrophica bacterium CG1_02_49_10]
MNKRLLITISASLAVLLAIVLVVRMSGDRVPPEERRAQVYNKEALDIYSQGSELLSRGDRSGAASYYQKITEEYPLSTSASLAYMALGDIESKEASLLQAKQYYREVIDKFPDDTAAIEAQKKLEDINMRLLFSPAPTEKSIIYTIEPGDTLIGIARKFHTTVELIQKSNNISGDTIRPFKKIKITKAEYSIFVDKSQNTLTLKTGDEVLKVYTVATGSNSSTPVGEFKIVNKLKDPVWFKSGAIVPPDSPENILGTRWMGLDEPGYGIHGTTEPDSIGKQVTAGCVRMPNKDVEELYSIIPEGTKVTIVD